MLFGLVMVFQPPQDGAGELGSPYPTVRGGARAVLADRVVLLMQDYPV